MDTILVTGATGQLGQAVVEALADGGINVRAAARKISGIKRKEQVQPVFFDYENPGLYEAALDKIAGVFLIAPPLDPEAPAKLIPFIDKAKKMGITYAVFNSALRADSDERSPLRIIERHLMGSGLDWVILRPNFFMENFSTGWAAPMIESGQITVPADDGKTSFISVSDIARVATVCFQEKRSGAQYNLTGSEALSHAEVAQIISGVCGRTVAYNPISEAELMKSTREQGMPESAIQYIVQLFTLVRKGMMAEITDTVREVTGKPPVSFTEFARKNAGIWKMPKAA